MRRPTLTDFRAVRIHGRNHFEEDSVMGTPFPSLKSCRNAWERRYHC